MPVLGRAGRTVNTSHINASEAAMRTPKSTTYLVMSGSTASGQQDRGWPDISRISWRSFAQRPLAGRTGGSVRGRVLQVDRSPALQTAATPRAQRVGSEGTR